MSGMEKVVEGFTLILEGLGLDTNGPHLEETPRRAARAWYNELCSGLTKEPPRLTTFESDRDEMILLRSIPVHSLCAHHLLPFIGTATVGYVPARGRILGLSKLSRIVDYHARRPQVQEDLTEQIADHMSELVLGAAPNGSTTGGVGVVIRANHLCMAIRGVRHDGDMITSAVRGVFRHNASARAEFLDLARP